MNWNVILKFILATGIICGGFCACKKETSPTIFTRLTGKWKEVQYATDDNNSGVLQPWELKNVDKSYLIYLTFNKDSMGTESITVNDSTTVFPFSWVLLENDSLQRDGIGHDTIIYNITNITALSMTLKTSTSKGLVWYVYNKK